ncbi:MAG TPA: hypothetical protein VGC55_01670 [Dokdonella sp.]
MKTGLLVAALIFSFCASSAFAKDEAEPAVNANTKASFETVSTWVRKQMEAGGRYSEINAGERSKVDSKLDEMGRMFDKNGDVAHMSDDDKTRMFNTQQEINAILNKRDGERLICKSERPVGSNIPVKTCNTASQIAARRQNDTQDFRHRQDVQAQQRGGN